MQNRGKDGKIVELNLHWLMTQNNMFPYDDFTNLDVSNTPKIIAYGY